MNNPTIRQQAEAGDIDGAESAAWRIDDAGRRADAFGDIAEVQAMKGDMRGVQHALRGIGDEGLRARARRNLAIKLAKDGRIFDADHVAQPIGNDHDKLRGDAYRVIADVSCGQGRIGNAVEAMIVVHRRELPTSAYFESLLNVSGMQAKRGDIDGAKKTARRIGDVCTRAYALSDIAEIQAEAGDVIGAEETLAEASQSARKIQAPTELREKTLAHIKAIQAKVLAVCV